MLRNRRVKEMLLGGQIEPSDSPWASPVVLVTKKDGSTRFCVDHRQVNSLTIKAAFVTNEGLFQFRVMPFGLCNAPATFEHLMDRVLCGMMWSRCLVSLDDVISFGASIPEALARLEEVLCRLSDLGWQLKAKKCTFMQMEVAFLGHIVGRTGLACDPEKISLVRKWHAPDKIKVVRQFVGFVGYIIASLLRILWGWRSLWWH